MKLKKGDNIQIMVGKDSGKQGKISIADPKAGKILIQGLNMVKKHKRPAKQGEKGEIVSLPRFMKASSAMLVCPSCNKPTRVGMKMDKEIKVRFCKKCKAII